MSLLISSTSTNLELILSCENWRFCRLHGFEAYSKHTSNDHELNWILIQAP